MTILSSARSAILLAALSFPIVVGAQAQDLLRAGNASAEPLAKLVSPSSNPFAGVAMEQMRHFLDRPLFSQSRQPFHLPPPPPAVAQALSAAPSASNLRLVGTIQMPTGWSALIQGNPGGPTQTVSHGELIDGWKVVAIGPLTVRIAHGSVVADLVMFTPNPQVAASPSAAEELALPGPVVANPEPLAAPNAAALAKPLQQAGQDTPSRSVAASKMLPPGIAPGSAAAQAISRSTDALTFGVSPPSETANP